MTSITPGVKMEPEGADVSAADAAALEQLAAIRANLGAAPGEPGWVAHRWASTVHHVGADSRAACGRYVSAALSVVRYEAPPENACPDCIEWLQLRAQFAPRPLSEGRRAEIAAELARLMGEPEAEAEEEADGGR